MINPSEAALQNALQTNIKKAEALLHADFSRESGLIEKNGALRYLQQLLRRGQESPGFSQKIRQSKHSCFKTPPRICGGVLIRQMLT